MYTLAYDNIKIHNNKYDIGKIIAKYYKKSYICLDLGCGSCRKIIPFLDIVKYYYAIDIASNRIRDAQQYSSIYKNLLLGIADNFYLPFKNNSFDLVTCLMAKYSISEVWRVLKQNGIFILESVGPNDKLEIKKCFGKDNLGWRGRLMEDTTEDYINRLKKSLSPFFEIIEIQRCIYTTAVPFELAIELFQMTSDIRNFNLEKDINVLYKLRNSNNDIVFNEEKFIIVCNKKLI